VWYDLAGTVREQQARPFRAGWHWVSAAIGGALPVAPFLAFNQIPQPPPPTDGAYALQVLAVRAARRAVAANPDHPDAYYVLALTAGAGHRDLVLPGQDQQELLVQQVVGFRQYLDRCPPPDAAPLTTAQRAMSAAANLAGLYREPGLTADVLGQGVPMADLSREAARTSAAYATRVALVLKDPEQRKRFLEEYERRKVQADDDYTRRNDRYELYLKASNPKPPQQIQALLQLGLIGRAIDVFKEAKLDEFGPNSFFVAVQMVGLKLRAGRLAEAEEDAGVLDEKVRTEYTADPKMNRELVRQAGLRVRTLQAEVWRATGNYGKLGEAMEADFQQQKWPDRERAMVVRAASGAGQWVGLTQGGLAGAVGGGGVGVSSDRYVDAVLSEWLRESNFYLVRGVVAVLAGDIPGARRRFSQALRPQGIEMPTFRPERVLAERYLRMIDSAAK
jgi:hypothetical protein